MNFPMRPAEMLFQLGKLQVFWFPTEEEITKNTFPYDIYWRDTVTANAYGPFKSIHLAMEHYTWMVSQQKNEKHLKPEEAQKDADVIFMDFRSKKRVIYDLPGGNDGKV